MPDKPNPADIKRILIIKWSAMGDLVLGSAIFEDVRKAFPDADIHLNTLPTWKGLFRAVSARSSASIRAKKDINSEMPGSG